MFGKDFHIGSWNKLGANEILKMNNNDIKVEIKYCDTLQKKFFKVAYVSTKNDFVRELFLF